jgi:hypothetical protein
VVREGDRSVPITEEQVAAVQNHIGDVMSQQPLDKEPATFRQSGVLKCVLAVTCADQHSYDWLVQTVAGMPDSVTGHKMEAVSWKEFSLRRARIYVLGAARSNERLLRCLCWQNNRHLDCTSWRVLSQKADGDKGFHVILGMDKAAAEQIEAAASSGTHTVFFELTRIRIRVESVEAKGAPVW